MFIIGVLPIARGAPHRELSYFSPGPLTLGTIVRIRVRNKSAFGLVMRSASLAEEKQVVRKSSFTLNKIAPKDAGAPLSRPYLRAAFETAAYFAVSPGAVLEKFTPAAVLKRAAKLPQALEEKDREDHHQILSLSAPLSERIAEYRALARESLARGSSLLIIAPTIFEAERLGREVGRGIEERVMVIHGSLSEKNLIEKWRAAVSSKQSVLIAGTPLALSCPREDIDTIIIERETSRNFEEDTRPYLSVKRMAEFIAKARGIRLILASTTPSVETVYRERMHETSEYGLPHRRLSGVPPTILDAKLRAKEKPFDPLLPEAYEVLDTSLRAKTPVLILAARRGAAPLTVCDDCSSSLLCSRCHSPLVLHRTDASRFLCHFCGMEESASIRCRTCGGWRLTALGIGVERIAETLAKKRPDLSLAVASHDRMKTKNAPKLAESFLGGDPQVLISTEFMVPYLPDGSVNIIVASIDSFMSVPEYRMNERIFSLLAELRSKAKDSYLIETRIPENSALRACAEGSAARILREESEERERYGYPPALTIVRISTSGKNAKEEAERIVKALEERHAPKIREGRLGGRFHILLRVKGVWPDLTLLKFLRTLPPSIEVRINPPSLSLD